MAEVGKILRKARVDRGLSIDDIQQLTKIQKRYLEAIEQDDFSQMPGTFYVRGFIRQFAEAVALDGQKILDIFDDKIDPETGSERVPNRAEEISGSRSKNHGNRNLITNKKRFGLPVIILTVVVVVLAGGIIYMTYKDMKSKGPIIPESSSVEVDRDTGTSSSAVTSTDSSESSTTTSTSEAPKASVEVVSVEGSEVNLALKNASSPVKLEFTGVTGPCWLGVLVNGEYVYQYTLQAGNVQETTLPANVINATIVLGASNNVKVKADGVELNFNPNNDDIIKRNVNLTVTYSGQLMDGQTTATTTTTTTDEQAEVTNQ